MIEYVKDRPGHDRRYAMDATRIKKELGWHAKYDFDMALELTIKWYQQNTKWYSGDLEEIKFQMKGRMFLIENKD